MLTSRRLPVANTWWAMSEWHNRWMLRLLETTDRSAATACCCNCHCLSLWFHVDARVGSGFVMIAQASVSAMGVFRFTWLRRGVGVLEMPDAGMDTAQRIESVYEVTTWAGGLRLLVPGVAVEVFIHHRCVADGMEAMRWIISATRELFNEDVGLDLWSWIVPATEFPLWVESLLPAGPETGFIAWGCGELTEGQQFCWFWRFARLRALHTTRVMSVGGLLQGIVRYI